MKGKVKFFNDVKWFGFITVEDGNDYFFHSTGLVAGVQVTKEDSVSFETEKGEKGLKAVKVTKA